MGNIRKEWEMNSSAHSNNETYTSQSHIVTRVIISTMCCVGFNVNFVTAMVFVRNKLGPPLANALLLNQVIAIAAACMDI